MKALVFGGFYATALLFFPVFSAFSIEVDNFSTGPQAVTDTKGLPASVNDITNATVLGGFREVVVSTSAAPNTINNTLAGVDDLNGIFGHSQDVSTEGISTVIYDGDNVAGINPTGLGGVDLYNNDGSDSFRIVVESFDYPNNKPVSIEIKVFDAGDGTGNTWSAATFTLNSQVNSTTNFDIPFANFTTVGFGGGADFSNVGAITLAVNGTGAPAADLIVDWFGTNGECAQIIPDAGEQVKDQCGVCGGDNSSCVDCKGVVNGNAQELRCGCEDDTSCLDCHDVDISKTQFVLDGTAKKQEKHIGKMLKRLLELSQSKATKAFVNVTKKTAHALQVRNWILSWTMPSVTLQCGNKSFCVDLDTENDEILAEYRTHSDELRDLGIEVMKRIEKIVKVLSITEQRLLKKNLKLHSSSYELADSVPLTVSYCF